MSEKSIVDGTLKLRNAKAFSEELGSLAILYGELIELEKRYKEKFEFIDVAIELKIEFKTRLITTTHYLK